MSQTKGEELYSKIEELFEKYLQEDSVEKIFALYHIIKYPYNAGWHVTWKFGSIKPLTQVIEDFKNAGISVEKLPYEVRSFIESLLNTRALSLITKDALELCKNADKRVKKTLSILSLILERNGSIPDIEVMLLRTIYVTLTGDLIDDNSWRNHVIRMLGRMHLIDPATSGKIIWYPWAPYVLEAVKEHVPKIEISFE